MEARMRFSRMRFFVMSPDHSEVHIKQFSNVDNAFEFDDYLNQRGLSYIALSLDSGTNTWVRLHGNNTHIIDDLLQEGKARLVADNMDSIGG